MTRLFQILPTWLQRLSRRIFEELLFWGYLLLAIFAGIWLLGGQPWTFTG